MKQLTVDWDNPQDLTKTISILHQRKRELEGYIGKKEKAKEKLSLMRDIWQSEVPLKGSQLSSEPIFYVYAHFVKGHNNFPSQKDALAMFCHSLGLPAIPFYIGKGTGGRHTNKERNKGHQLVRSFSESHGLDTQSHVILEGLTEVESLVYEGKLIDILGQRVLKTGPLTNLDEGYKPLLRRRSYLASLGSLHSIFYKPTLGDQRSSHTT